MGDWFTFITTTPLPFPRSTGKPFTYPRHPGPSPHWGGPTLSLIQVYHFSTGFNYQSSPCCFALFRLFRSAYPTTLLKRRHRTAHQAKTWCMIMMHSIHDNPSRPPAIFGSPTPSGCQPFPSRPDAFLFLSSATLTFLIFYISQVSLQKSELPKGLTAKTVRHALWLTTYYRCISHTMTR